MSNQTLAFSFDDQRETNLLFNTDRLQESFVLLILFLILANTTLTKIESISYIHKTLTISYIADETTIILVI
jgi:hypothetical protein